MNESPRLRLPFLTPGQAQKEMFHNEALQILDCLVGACVEGEPLNDPPSPAAEGATYLLGPQPTGEWSGKAHHIAQMSAGGWRFVPPAEGLRLTIRDTGQIVAFHASAWEIGVVRADLVKVGGDQVLAARHAPIAEPTGGATVDAEARGAIAQVLAALRHHGLVAN